VPQEKKIKILCALKERISPKRNKPEKIIGCAIEVHSTLVAQHSMLALLKMDKLG